MSTIPCAKLQQVMGPTDDLLTRRRAHSFLRVGTHCIIFTVLKGLEAAVLTWEGLWGGILQLQDGLCGWSGYCGKDSTYLLAYLGHIWCVPQPLVAC
jgi:hypothetical protein